LRFRDESALVFPVYLYREAVFSNPRQCLSIRFQSSFL